MSAQLLSATFLALLCCANVPAQSTRGFEQASAPASNLSPGTYYALVIGIDNYPALPNLTTAVHDARAIGALLESSFGFKGHVIYLLNQDATRVRIMDALGGARGYTQILSESDNLLIYFAGHGYYDKRADRAYWLPYDAESPLSANHISSDDLTTGIRGLSSRHVLVVSDSCYSGDLTRGVDDSLTTNGDQSFIRRMIAAPSRNLLASGGNEPVTDSGPSGHSIFAAALLHALAEQSASIFTAADVADPVKKMVRAHSSQIPEYSRIGNSMPRDFPPSTSAISSSREPAKQHRSHLLRRLSLELPQLSHHPHRLRRSPPPMTNTSRATHFSPPQDSLKPRQFSLAPATTEAHPDALISASFTKTAPALTRILRGPRHSIAKAATAPTFMDAPASPSS